MKYEHYEPLERALKIVEARIKRVNKRAHIKSSYIKVMLTPKEHRDISRLAKKKYMSVSELVRFSLSSIFGVLS